MLELIKLRAQMLSGTLPVDEMKDYKLKATAEIDTGNKLLGEAWCLNPNYFQKFPLVLKNFN